MGWGVFHTSMLTSRTMSPPPPHSQVQTHNPSRLAQVLDLPLIDPSYNDMSARW
ncbi:hypothetical protein BJV78DRAFT_1216787 [Lactifluus subvellereus]|nr:hypothetical protein BJV78DRAFT_1216787 [Lactifluus subvellereus]